MTKRKAKLLTHDGVNDSNIVSLLISNQLNFTHSCITHSNLRNNWGNMPEDFILFMKPSSLKSIHFRVDIFCVNMFYSHKQISKDIKCLNGWQNTNRLWQFENVESSKSKDSQSNSKTQRQPPSTPRSLLWAPAPLSRTPKWKSMRKVILCSRLFLTFYE